MVAKKGKAETAPKGKKAEKKIPREKEAKQAPITKKSIMIGMLEKGATIEDMAQKCTEAGLGNLERNIKTVKLWLPKIGVKVKKDPETQKWRRA